MADQKEFKVSLKVTKNKTYLVKQTQLELEISYFKAEGDFLIKILTKNIDSSQVDKNKSLVYVESEITAFSVTDDHLYLATQNKIFYLINIINQKTLANLLLYF